MEKTATELRAAAKEILMENLAVAYYRLEEEDGYSEEEKEAINKYIDQYATRMAKAIKRNYYSM